MERVAQGLVGPYNLTSLGVPFTVHWDKGTFDVVVHTSYGRQEVLGLRPTLDRAAHEYRYADGQALTLLAPAIAGMLSALSIFGLFLYIILRYYRRSSGNGSATSFWFGSPMGACLLSLFLSDLLGALGWSMSLRWVLRNRQTASHACTFQAVVEQISTLGSAVFSAFMAGLTFSVLVLGARLRDRPLWIGIGGGWLYVFIIMAAGPLRSLATGVPPGRFFGPSSPFCFINFFSRDARAFILITQCTALTAAALSLASYLSIYAKLSGHFPSTSLAGRLFGQMSSRDRSGGSSSMHRSAVAHKDGRVAAGGGARAPEDIGRQVQKICRKLLLYPTLYMILVTPLCVVRLFTTTHDAFQSAAFPWGVIVFASTFMALSGFANVLLFVFTRNSLVLRHERRAVEVQVATTRYVVTEEVEDYAAEDPNHKTVRGYPLGDLRQASGVDSFGDRSNHRLSVHLAFAASDDDLKDSDGASVAAHSLNYSQSTINQQPSDKRHLL